MTHSSIPPKPMGTARALDRGPSLRWRLRRWILQKLDAWPREKPGPRTEWGELRRAERARLQRTLHQLNLPGHRCEPIADLGRYMNDMGQKHAGEREWWIGRLTEPIEGFPQERWCFHIRTPLKPEIVFGFNEADLNYLVATIYAALEYHTNPDWVEEIAASGIRAVERAREEGVAS